MDDVRSVPTRELVWRVAWRGGRQVLSLLRGPEVGAIMASGWLVSLIDGQAHLLWTMWLMMQLGVGVFFFSQPLRYTAHAAVAGAGLAVACWLGVQAGLL